MPRKGGRTPASVLACKACNRRTSGRLVIPVPPRMGGDEPRGAGVVTAVDPQLATARQHLDQRASAEPAAAAPANPRQPIAAPSAAGGTSIARLVAEHGHGECGVQHLMPARQAGQGKRLSSALPIAVTQLAIPNGNVPMQPARFPDGARLPGDFADPGGQAGRIELGHERNAALGDSRLFRRNVGHASCPEMPDGRGRGWRCR